VKKDLEEETQRTRQRVLNEYARRMDDVASKCESPIESAVLWALAAHDTEGGVPVPDTEYDLPSFSFELSGGALRIYPQCPVNVEGHKYRLDFLASATATGPTVSGGTQRICVPFDVECDGHDFHERSKEQARRDKARDRALQATGYTVLRFTGSEIYADPAGVAAEIVQRADAALSERMNAAIENRNAAQASKKETVLENS
jgi:hypothetical protein